MIFVGGRPSACSWTAQAEGGRPFSNRTPGPSWLLLVNRSARRAQTSTGPGGLQNLIQLRSPAARVPPGFANLPSFSAAWLLRWLRLPGFHFPGFQSATTPNRGPAHPTTCALFPAALVPSCSGFMPLRTAAEFRNPPACLSTEISGSQSRKSELDQPGTMNLITLRRHACPQNEQSRSVGGAWNRGLFAMPSVRRPHSHDSVTGDELYSTARNPEGHGTADRGTCKIYLTIY